MTRTFHASAIHTEQTDDHVLIGLADDPTSPDDYVVIMRALKAAAGAPPTVVESVYFEYGGETMSGHGCLTSIDLKRGRMTLRIDRQRCKIMPHAEIVITLDAASETVARLPGLLRLVVNDTIPLKLAD